AVTNSAASGQSSSTTPTTPPSAASSDRSALPDSPSPANSQVQPQPQTPDFTQGQSSSSSLQPHVLTYANPDAQVTVPEDTLIRVMTNQPLTSRQSKDGTLVLFTMNEDVIAD